MICHDGGDCSRLEKENHLQFIFHLSPSVCRGARACELTKLIASGIWLIYTLERVIDTKRRHA